MKWCSVAPIFNCSHFEDDPALPFCFGNSIVLETLPAWVREERTIKELDGYKRTEISRRIRFALSVAYEANSADDLDTDWRETPGRTKHDRALESFQLVNLALWLAQPSSFSFSVVIHALYMDDTWIWKKIEEIAPLVPHVDDRGANLSSQLLEQSKELYSILASLNRKGSIWMAVRALSPALTQSLWEVRYLNHWTVLESLFGPEDSRELSYRLTQRMALFLAGSRAEASTLFQEIKEGYGWRSKIVHGRQLNKLHSQKSIDLMHRAEDYIRRALLKILKQPQLIEAFEGKVREDFLDTLAFS